MKILIVRTTPNKVNLKTYNLQEVGLAKALVRKGNVCDVAYYSDEKTDRIEKIEFDDEKGSINILWLHGYGRFYEGIYPSLKNYIKDYDIIQVGGYVGITSCMLNRRAKKKVVNYQGAYYHKENKGDIRKALIMDHLLLPFSHKKNMIAATKSKLATQYLRSKGIDNAYTIGVGIDQDKFRTQEDMYAHPFVEKLKENKNESRYLLYIGRIEDRRNTLFLLDVLLEVKKDIHNVKLVMIGSGEDEYVQKCREKIDKLGIKDNVFWQDRMEQKYLREVYELSDIFLLPTKYEIFGMVLLEAMYFGVPVVTTYNGGSSTLMNEDNGVIIDNFSASEWGKKIVEILNNEELRKKISDQGMKTIRDGYTWDVLADRFLEVYNKRLKD